MAETTHLLRDPRYRSLDLWRGIACLMVVLHHAGFVVDRRDLAASAVDDALGSAVLWFFKQMDLGVPLFFVISGYCIAASADSHRRKGKSPWVFLQRRLWRIYPPYWVALALFVLIVGGLDWAGLSRLHAGQHALELKSPGQLSLAQWMGNITLTESWRFHVFGNEELIYTRIAWSLCYEEQFYLVCFLTLLLAPKRLYVALTVATLAILAVRVAAWDSGFIVRFTGTFVMLWHEFAIGLVVYHRLNVAATSQSRRLDEAFLLFMLGVAIAVGYRESAVAAAFGLILVVLRSWDDRLADARPLAFLFACGRRCYSIYLMHLPFCVVGNLALYELGFHGFWTRVFVVVPLVSTLAVAACWVFYHLVERHFLNPPLLRNGPGITSRLTPAVVGRGSSTSAAPCRMRSSSIL